MPQENSSKKLVSPTKQELRTGIRRNRKERSPNHTKNMAEAMATTMQKSRLLRAAPTGEPLHIGAYIPIENEPNIMPLLEILVKQPERFFLPSIPRIWFPQTTAEHELTWFDGTQNVVLNFGAPLLSPKRPQRRKTKNLTSNAMPNHYGALRNDAVEFSWLFVPSLALSADGTRLGQGGSYYDRFLPQLSPYTKTIGCIYDNEFYEAFPFREEHDHPVDYVFTPSQVAKLPNPLR